MSSTPDDYAFENDRDILLNHTGNVLESIRAELATANNLAAFKMILDIPDDQEGLDRYWDYVGAIAFRAIAKG